jgi:1-acyl-sn-glycerol-3-phosphate acyltransferase
MMGTQAIMPIGSRLPRIRRVGVVFGEALDFSRFEGLEGDRFILRSITDEIVYALHGLGGQEYEDVYASTVKERRPSVAR